jgi:hypothetical protein
MQAWAIAVPIIVAMALHPWGRKVLFWWVAASLALVWLLIEARDSVLD